jgi:hypothetical protein
MGRHAPQQRGESVYWMAGHSLGAPCGDGGAAHAAGAALGGRDRGFDLPLEVLRSRRLRQFARGSRRVPARLQRRACPVKTPMRIAAARPVRERQRRARRQWARHMPRRTPTLHGRVRFARDRSSFSSPQSVRRSKSEARDLLPLSTVAGVKPRTAGCSPV